MSKGLKIFLAVSVLLNVLLAGILIGAFSHTMLWRMDKGKRAFSFARSLPPAKRDMLIDTMKKMKNESRETRKKIKKARQEVLDAFSAPEFDPERFDRSVATLHALMKELTDEIAGETKKIALELSPEERKQLADMMRRGPGPPFPQFLMERSLGHGGPPPPPRSGDEDWHGGPGGNPLDEPE
jgi:uncharacterized membrane protein